MLPPDFDSDKKYEDPLIQKMISILYKSHDAPFLREDYDTLKKIYLYIQHIQELKASIQQKKLDTGINIPRYYRTDIISKQWIADNAKNIEIMMNAFEKAGFTDEEISPPDRMDEVTRAEHYKNMRGNIFSILDDNNGNNNETDLMIANT